MTYFKVLVFFCICLIPSTFVCEELDDEEIPVIENDIGMVTVSVENDVLVLTRENFDLQVAARDTLLVEFYAPWCGHCKELEPEYAEAAKILKDEGSLIALAKIDATIETEIATRFDVNGFPTLLLFKKGKHIAYEGPRTAMGIVEYVKERGDPDWKPPPEAVITLTEENFSDIVDEADIILVEFYAPWCGHCKRLAPEYERAAKVLKNLATPIPLAKVDGVQEKSLAEKHGAKGWPTLMIFRKGKKYEYEGPRDESGIISFMKKQAKPPSQEVKSVKVLKNSFGKIDATIVGFFESDASDFYKNFLESANILRGKFSIFHTFDEKIAQQFNSKVPQIVLFQPEIYATKYEPVNYKFENEEAEAADITIFIRSHHLPLVAERSKGQLWKYQDKYPLVVVYYDVNFGYEHRVQTQLVRKEVAKVAKDYKGKITFAVSNEEDFEDELLQLNLGDSGEDVNVGYFESSKARYKMEPVEDFSEEELRTFVEMVQSGKIPRQIKSQTVPKDNKGPVITVVGSTFEKLVSNSEKDVLLEFYAPWCGHCQKLEPVYKKLGNKFADNEKVLIAKFDATSNDFPDQFQVSGFPTIFYIPAANKNNIISYDGERNLEALSEFINKQLSEERGKDEL